MRSRFSSLSLTLTSHTIGLHCPARLKCGKTLFLRPLTHFNLFGALTPHPSSVTRTLQFAMGKFTIRSFLREQWTTIPLPKADISDKSIVVAGANVGLGFEAAIHLAKLRPKRLLLTTRDEAKCKQTKQGMKTSSLSTPPADSQSLPQISNSRP